MRSGGHVTRRCALRFSAPFTHRCRSNRRGHFGSCGVAAQNRSRVRRWRDFLGRRRIPFRLLFRIGMRWRCTRLIFVRRTFGTRSRRYGWFCFRFAHLSGTRIRAGPRGLYLQIAVFHWQRLGNFRPRGYSCLALPDNSWQLPGDLPVVGLQGARGFFPRGGGPRAGRFFRRQMQLERSFPGNRSPDHRDRRQRLWMARCCLRRRSRRIGRLSPDRSSVGNWCIDYLRRYGHYRHPGRRSDHGQRIDLRQRIPKSGGNRGGPLGPRCLSGIFRSLDLLFLCWSSLWNRRSGRFLPDYFLLHGFWRNLLL